MRIRFFTPLFCLALLCGLSFAQNALPSITNTGAVADTVAQTVTVTFDLADAESDPLEVWLQASADSGRTWIVPVDSMSGDFGYPVTPGAGKSIVWHYDPMDLTDFGSGPTEFMLRVIADDRAVIDVQEIADAVDSARVVASLYMLEGVKHRNTGLAKLEEVKDSLEAILAAHGNDAYRDGPMFGGYQGENVIGHSSGTRMPREAMLISGHFDTVDDAPGADDNGSAVVTVLEAVRILSNYNTKRSLRYLFFDLEEEGLVGSIQYVLSGAPDWEDVHGLLNMDGIGYWDDTPNSQQMPFGFDIMFPAAYADVEADSFRGNFISSVVNPPSSFLDSAFAANAALFAPGLRIISLETPGTGLLTPDLRRSDHAPFWDAGDPALFLADGANYRNPNYHQPTDTVESLHMPFLLDNLTAVVTTLADLAGLEHSTTRATNAFTLGLPVVAGISPAAPALPVFSIYPNPSEGAVNFRVELSSPGPYRIEVRDHHGRLLATASEGHLPAGGHRLHWKGKLPAGHYSCMLRTEQGASYAPLVIHR